MKFESDTIEIKMIKYKNACHPTNSKRAIPFSLALRLRWVCSTVQRSYFTKKCYHHHYKPISMRSIHTNMQTSTPLHLIHHSQQTHEHFNLIPSFPHHIQVCTYCCLSTQQQPLQLFCTSSTTQPFKKQRTLRGSFQRGSHCCTCTYISNGLTSYTFRATGET